MFDEKLQELLETSRFTTVKIQKAFLPRRIGLGYDFKHEHTEMDIIKDLRRKQNKNRRKEVTKEIKCEDESEDENFSKSKMVK